MVKEKIGTWNGVPVYTDFFTDWNTSYWSKASEWQSKICGIP